LAQQGPVPAQAGIGLRFRHQAEAARGEADAPWFEVHPENYTHDAGALAALHAVRARRPLSLHAVGLSLGSAHGLDELHVARLKRLVQQLEPALVSDHLSWSAVPGTWLPDLLPLPYTDEALAVMCGNVAQVQQQLQRQILVENPSTYLQYADAALSEAQFLAELVRRTGCGVLLDVNNIYVSARNQHGDPLAALADMLQTLQPASIAELHLAGHATTLAPDHSELRIDDHGSRVCADVWQLYERVLARIGARPTLIEWDTQIPAFAVLAGEAGAAQQRLDDVQHADAV
jgi:uncharacterized protein (UPF0276 family)